ncbi:MAG: twin-arginine translocase TatA/TatE family subunit [Actinomycetota bacterium]
MNLGSTELIIVLIIVVVVFGGSWLPKAARNLGRAKVEVDKAQQQFNDAKTQVIEATGIEKADEALRKANRALNTSPQNLMKNAAKSAMTSTPSADADPAEGEAGAGDVGDGDGVSDDPTDVGTSETVNVDFTDDA